MARPYYLVELARACVAAGEAERGQALLTEAAELAVASGAAMLVRRIDTVTRREAASFGGAAGVRPVRERLFGAEEDGETIPAR